LVRWITQRDTDRALRFVPLQGAMAHDRLSQTLEDPRASTLLLHDGDGEHHSSEAVLRTLTQLGGSWAILGSIRLYVPRCMRDAAYRAMVRRQQSQFGHIEACEQDAPADEKSMPP
jgi:predicted DCC family thiol-disulfide oxidoreductase YuxK